MLWNIALKVWKIRCSSGSKFIKGGNTLANVLDLTPVHVFSDKSIRQDVVKAVSVVALDTRKPVLACGYAAKSNYRRSMDGINKLL